MSKKLNIDTSTLGSLSFSLEEGYAEDHTLTLCGKEVTIDVQIFENIATDKNIGIIKKYLDNISLMHEKAKEEIKNNYETNEAISEYVEDQNDVDWDEDCLMPVFGIDSIDKLSPEVIIQNLEIRTLFIAEDEDELIDCTIDFSLNKEYSDALLVFRFNNDIDIYDITEES